MKKIQCTEEFGSSTDKIWNLITNRTECAWRSTINKCEASPGGCFLEYTKKGVCTEYAVVLKIPHERCEYTFQNKYFSGRDSVSFRKFNGRTRVTFALEAQAKGGWYGLLLGRRLKKQQKIYMQDLKRALGE